MTTSSVAHSAAESLLIGAIARLQTSANSTRSTAVVNRRPSAICLIWVPISSRVHSASSSQAVPIGRASVTAIGAAPAAWPVSALSVSPLPSPKCLRMEAASRSSPSTSRRSTRPRFISTSGLTLPSTRRLWASAT
jgi:hypothetical protein